MNMDKSMSDVSISDFTSVLASKEAAPGGGGASALAGALGTALGSMVGSLTLGKKKYADVEDDIKALMSEAEDIRIRLLKCIDKDAEAFLPLSKAYSIPKEDPERDEILEKCLRDAAGAPFGIAELCCESVRLLEGFAEKGSRMMLSDAATGAVITRGALLGAAMNVKVNTRLMKDRDYAEGLEKELDAMTGEYCARADRIFEKIYRGE